MLVGAAEFDRRLRWGALELAAAQNVSEVEQQHCGNETTNSCVQQKRRDQTMNNVTKVGIVLLVLGVIGGFAQAADKEEKPDATLRLSGGSIAAGVGISWGKGTLTYKGKEYPVSINGLSLGKLGVTEITASGEVYNLKNLQDFDGNYTAASVGMTLAGGGSSVAMKNQNEVRVVIASTSRGVDLTIGEGGVKMKIKK
jgi:hypothetical protein